MQSRKEQAYEVALSNTLHDLRRVREGDVEQATARIKDIERRIRKALGRG